MGFFKKKELNVGYWWLVDYSNEAKEFSVGHNFNKLLILMHNNDKMKEEDFNESRISQLKREGQVVIDVTGGSDFPMDSVMLPRESVVFGTIQLFRRL